MLYLLLLDRGGGTSSTERKPPKEVFVHIFLLKMSDIGFELVPYVFVSERTTVQVNTAATNKMTAILEYLKSLSLQVLTKILATLLEK